jgi:hypothetical protein
MNPVKATYRPRGDRRQRDWEFLLPRCQRTLSSLKPCDERVRVWYLAVPHAILYENG